MLVLSLGGARAPWHREKLSSSGVRYHLPRLALEPSLSLLFVDCAQQAEREMDAQSDRLRLRALASDLDAIILVSFSQEHRDDPIAAASLFLLSPDQGISFEERQTMALRLRLRGVEVLF